MIVRSSIVVKTYVAIRAIIEMYDKMIRRARACAQMNSKRAH